MFPVRLNDDVVLELLEPRHAEELFRLAEVNREHLRRWLGWVDGTRSVDDTKRFIRRMGKQLGHNRGFQTVIRFRGSLVGVIGHHRVDWANRSVALGYWLTADAQGHGVMTESCRAFVRHAFDVWKLNRVEIRCAVENARSRAIPERLGFRAEGIVREAEWLYDRFVDHVVYGLLAGDRQDG